MSHVLTERPEPDACERGYLRALGTTLAGGGFARAVSWSFAAAAASQGLSLVAAIIMARLLGTSEYGQIGIIQSTAGMFGIFAGMGLGITATKHVAEYRDTDRERAGRVIALTSYTALISSGVAGLALWTCAPQLAAHSLRSPQLVAELRISTLLLIFNALQGVQTGILAGIGSFKAIAVTSALKGMAMCAIAAFAVMFWQLRGAVCALAASAAFGVAVTQIALRLEYRRAGLTVRRRGAWAERATIWRFSLPAMLGGVISVPATWLASTILIAQVNGYAEMGIFTAANQWRMAISFVASVLAQPLLERFSNLSASGNREAYVRLLLTAIAGTLALTAVLGLFIVIACPWILAAYGPAFAAGRTSLLLLAAATVISSGAAVVGHALASLARMWAGFSLNFAWAVVLLSATRLLAPAHGAAGLAGAMLIAYLIHAVTISAYTGWLLAGNLRRPDAVVSNAEPL